MTVKQNALMDDLFNLLPKDEEKVYREIVNYIVKLGYIPQKQKVQAFDLSFKHKENGKVIAKIGISKQKGNFRLKYFACKDVSEKYMKALYDEAVANENRYSREVPPPDSAPIPKNEIMKKCTLICHCCSGGGMRYFHQFPDGREVFRCTAYPVFVPNIEENDIDELKRLISEQHDYFLTIA
ncbi:MAG: hypothetical protein FWF05_06615 [Oscillospiraceae bacterium]|nr:hypothetical protein [Oscillospiraceae bacterium]